MDDANLPSLLSSSKMGYVSSTEEVYQNTRMFALSEANPYWCFGEVFNAIGGPHLGLMKAWPIASMIRVMTSDEPSSDEIRHEIKALLNSTAGLGKANLQKSISRQLEANVSQASSMRASILGM